MNVQEKWDQTAVMEDDVAAARLRHAVNGVRGAGLLAVVLPGVVCDRASAERIVSRRARRDAGSVVLTAYLDEDDRPLPIGAIAADPGSDVVIEVGTWDVAFSGARLRERAGLQPATSGPLVWHDDGNTTVLGKQLYSGERLYVSLNIPGEGSAWVPGRFLGPSTRNDTPAWEDLLYRRRRDIEPETMLRRKLSVG